MQKIDTVQGHHPRGGCRREPVCSGADVGTTVAKLASLFVACTRASAQDVDISPRVRIICSRLSILHRMSSVWLP